MEPLRAAFHYVEQQVKEYWPKAAPYAVPPVAASAAIVPVFQGYMVKSRMQRGLPYRDITWASSLREGLTATKSIGVLVGAQAVMEGKLKERLKEKTELGATERTVVSAVTVGFFSTPFVVIFNGRTMGWDWKQSLLKLNRKQFAATTLQESGFVAGFNAAGTVSELMKENLGEHKALNYVAAYVAGFAGSLLGHPGNTLITRDQDGMKTAFNQLMLGAGRRSHTGGMFCVVYTIAKELLKPTN